LSGTHDTAKVDLGHDGTLRVAKRGARDVLDIFVGGANVTALVAAAHHLEGARAPSASSASIGGVLRDLGAALLELSETSRMKRIVRFYDDPWELCIERWGIHATLSVYRGGTDPIVAVHDRVVPFSEIRDSATEAIESLVLRGTAPRGLLLELRAVAEALRTTSGNDTTADAVVSCVLPPAIVAIEGDESAPLSLSGELLLREGTKPAYEPSVERTDMHALLFRGRLRARVRDRDVDLGEGHPFLIAERLLDVARRLLDAWERGAPEHIRSDAGGVLVSARLGHDGVLSLSLAGAKTTRRVEAVHTFPALRVADFVDASLTLGRGIVRALLRRDRSQSNILRLSAFRRQLREVEGLLREASRDDAKTNPSPESYRAFASARRDENVPARGAGGARDIRVVDPPTRLRFRRGGERSSLGSTSALRSSAATA
jgi:hypothetical protein